jgi:hypothetical protein
MSSFHPLKVDNITLNAHTHSNHSSIDGHLGCCHIMAIVNSDTMNMRVLICLLDLDSVLLNTYLEARLLNVSIALF